MDTGYPLEDGSLFVSSVGSLWTQGFQMNCMDYVPLNEFTGRICRRFQILDIFN